jgi:hypothetical protein
MAGMLLQFLILEHPASLKHVHVAAWCDNTPTVSWTNKLSSSHLAIAGRITRALALRIDTNKALPLISVSFAGINNIMVDVLAPCTFGKALATTNTFHLSDACFLQFLSHSFSLQDASWSIVFCVSNKLSSRIFSKLQGELSTLGSWLQITTL